MGFATQWHDTELFLQGEDRCHIFTLLDVNTPPQPDFFGRDVEALRVLWQFALPAWRHQYIFSGLGACRTPSDIVFKFLPHVEHIDHVITVMCIRYGQHVRLGQIQHRAHVVGVIVGSGHILGGR